MIFILLVFRLNGLAQDSVFRVFLVGDAGEDRETGPTLRSLGNDLLQHPNSAVLFLGDNSYKGAAGNTLPYGFLGFDSTALTQDKIRSQLNILKSYQGSVFFIPGNHDWWNSENAEKGRRKLKMEENFIEANLSNNPTLANPGNVFLPKDGNPGPCLVLLNNQKIAVIFIDIYSLMVPGFTKKYRDSLAREYKFYTELDSLLRKCAGLNQKIILAAHHPVVLRGPYGRELKDPELFSRIKASNINFPTYKRISDSIRTMIHKYPGSYYVSGHLHALQYIVPGDGIHYIISGAGSKTNHVSKKQIEEIKPDPQHQYLLWNNKGYFEIEFGNSGERVLMHYDQGEHVMEMNAALEKGQ
ncbi:MAG: metallophosphoesterase [Chitinophagales bacterium]